MSIADTTSNHRPDETIRGRWQLDPQRSTIQFRARHFWGLGTVKGHFEDYQGRLDLSADPAIELTIQAASVQTGNPRRDKHLRSADFFDSQNHPQICFVSDSVVPDDDALKIRGRLFARDRAIPLELDAHIRRLDGGLAIEAATTALHRELGMSWSPLGTIPPRSELVVKGYLVPARRRAG
jgi:polyisoprenoid-binding protein YceI